MGFSRKTLQTLNRQYIFYAETVNIKKLANLTANTENYGKITLNTNPHSDPHIIVLYLQIFNTQNYILFKISASALFLKYS